MTQMLESFKQAFRDSLAMIGLPTKNAIRAVELLHENHESDVVLECECGQRPARMCRLAETGRVSVSSSDHEAETLATRVFFLANPFCHLDATHLHTPLIE